jgi:hypothetical protein
VTWVTTGGAAYDPTIPPVDRTALEQGLRRLKLRHMRQHLDDINELALQEEPSYMDFLGYLVAREVEGRENTQKELHLNALDSRFTEP